MQSSLVAAKVTNEEKGEGLQVLQANTLRGKGERDGLVYLSHRLCLKVKHDKELKVGHM